MGRYVTQGVRNDVSDILVQLAADMFFLLPYIWLFWLCEILAPLGQNGGKEIMAHINFGSPRVWAKITSLLKLSYYLKWQNVCRCIACILVQSVKSNSVQK